MKKSMFALMATLVVLAAMGPATLEGDVGDAGITGPTPEGTLVGEPQSAEVRGWGVQDSRTCYYEGADAVARCSSCWRRYCSTHKCSVHDYYCAGCCGNSYGHLISGGGQCQGLRCYYEGSVAIGKCGSCGRQFCSAHKCKSDSWCTHCCGNYRGHKIASYGQCEGKKE